MQPRIVNGRADNAVMLFPYAAEVSVMHGEQLALQCTGSLISSTHVLTAAHVSRWLSIYGRRQHSSCVHHGSSCLGAAAMPHVAALAPQRLPCASQTPATVLQGQKAGCTQLACGGRRGGPPGGGSLCT